LYIGWYSLGIFTWFPREDIVFSSFINLEPRKEFQMGTEKRVLYCVFRPAKMPSTAEMRELFETSYPVFLKMDPVEFKCWWCDQERKEWGAFYVFKSETVLRDYANSDHWTKVAPEKYGCVPEWYILEVGAIIAKKPIVDFEGSWIDG
jgi:hypothetical protein